MAEKIRKKSYRDVMHSLHHPLKETRQQALFDDDE